jgi:hypothetical protein
MEYPAYGSDVTLELADGAGLTWKLVVPGIALGKPVTLKMTALTGVKSDEIPGDFKGGVLLEPDGLRFRIPATLPVSGEGLSDMIVLFTGTQEGSAMDLTLPGEDKNSALIDHFSSVAADDWQQQKCDELIKMSDEQDKAVRAEVKNFLDLHKNDIQVPVPPSIPIECADKATPSSDQFLNDASEPEITLIRKLLSIKKDQQLLGKDNDGSSFSLELLQLTSRLEEKARLLMQTYKGQEEKLIPDSQFVLSVAKSIQLLGGEYDSTLLADIGQWAADTVDQLIKDIREKHDYRKVNAVWLVAKWAALLGNDSKSVEYIMNKLEKALLFKFQGTFNFSMGDEEWILKSEFPVRMNISQGWNWMGSGSGTTAVTFKFTGPTAVTPPFVVNALINSFDACAGTANITVDRFYGESETITIRDHSVTQGYTFIIWDGSYQSKKGGGGTIDGYTFPVTVHNMDANAVDEAIEGESCSAGGCQANFEIKLVHTPK